MKHIIICLVCAVLLFSYIGESTMPQQLQATGTKTMTSVARVATAGAAVNLQKTAAKVQQVGILLGHADDLQTARFRKAFEKSINPEIKVNSVDAAGSLETQKTMFDKMISSGYSLIVLELMGGSSAEHYIGAAGQAGIPLVLIGAEPDAKLLAVYPNIYYLGFLDESLTRQMAEETFRLWESNPTLMNFEEDEWDLTYSALTTKGFEEGGQKETFESAMSELGVTTHMAVDSVTRHFDYNLHKEVDQTIIDDSEIVFYDSSVEVQKVINYFNDPTEFKKYPKQQLALSVIDDGAAKLVQDGDVVFACGTDPTRLGTVASKLAVLLMSGQEPNFQSLELEPVNLRCFYLPNTVLRADIPPEPVKVETEEAKK